MRAGNGPLRTHKIRETFSRFVVEHLVCDSQTNHTINTKTAKVIPRFAPGGERPVRAPQVARQRSNASFTELPLDIGVNEMHFLAITDRTAQLFESFAELFGNVEVRYIGAAAL